MADSKNLPQCEATKAGLVPPTDPDKYHEWRKSLDPDAMGFDGMEVTEDHESDN